MLAAEISLGHGMGIALEEKDWQYLIVRDIEHLQKYYQALSGDFSILWNSPRPFSSAALIQVAQQTFFVKRSHRSFRSAQDLMQEHLFIAHLAKKGVHVPQVLTAQTGMTAVEIGDWSYEIHLHSSAIDLYVNTPSWKPFFYAEHALQAGKMLAKLHLAAKDYDVVVGRTARYLFSNQDLLESGDIIQTLDDRIKNSIALTQYFLDKKMDSTVLNQLKQVHKKIVDALRQFPKIWTHNDFHASNLLWHSDTKHAEVASVIDFGLCDRTSIAYDVAVAIERNFIDWLGLTESSEIVIDYAGLAKFLQGYAAESDDLEQLKIVPELLKIVHVDFAFSELEYFIAITQNQQHADAAYYDWLLGHTKWFCSPQGIVFSDKLKSMMDTLFADRSLANPI